MARGRREARARRAQVVRRVLAVAGLALVGVLYYRPLTTYLERRETLAAREAEVRQLERRQAALERELAAATTEEALLRAARRLGYVKKGERLFIVKGIDAWRAARAPRDDR
jgi:cell division protein FtsB